MKLWNLFKSVTQVLTPVETALLKSLRENPNGWQVSLVAGNLVAHNRELSIILTEKQRVVCCKNMAFSAGFCSEWSKITWGMYNARINAEQAAEARITEAALKKALGVQ